jgi:hypothetical protein
MSTDLRAPRPRTAVVPVQVSPPGRWCAPGDSNAKTVDWQAILRGHCMVVNGSDGLAAIATDSLLVRKDHDVKDEKISPKRKINNQPEKVSYLIFSEPSAAASLSRRSLYPRL